MGRMLQGVDPEFDAADAEVEAASEALEEHLISVRKALGGGREVCFVSVNKDSHLIEVRPSPALQFNVEVLHLMKSCDSRPQVLCKPGHIATCEHRPLPEGRMLRFVIWCWGYLRWKG